MPKREKDALYQVTAKHLCAGLTFDDDELCTGAAPILRWAIGHQMVYIEGYCERKGWKLEQVQTKGSKR
jgi:hypothetical protein